jgi:hypothetical protein
MNDNTFRALFRPARNGSGLICRLPLAEGHLLGGQDRLPVALLLEPEAASTLRDLAGAALRRS